MKRGPCGAGWLALVSALPLALPEPASARELWRRDDFSLSLTGSLRELVSTTRSTDASDFQAAIAADVEDRILEALATPIPFVLPTDTCIQAEGFADCSAFGMVGAERIVQSLTRLRTDFVATAPWGLRARVAYDHELQSGHLDTLAGTVSAGFGGDSFLGAEDEILSRQHVAWNHLLYRAFLMLEREHLEIVVGRQRVAWGVGRLWNPIDRFNAIPPLAVEADQSVGVDALLVRGLLDGFTTLEAVYAPGTNRGEARYAMRLHSVLLGTDVSLMGGVFEQAPTFGFDVERNLGDAALHAEVVYTDPERRFWPVGVAEPIELSPYWQVVLSMDINLDLGNGVYVVVEHLYNGNALGFGRGRAGTLLPFFESTRDAPFEVDPGLGVPLELEGPFVAPASPDLFGASRVVSLAEHQSAVQLGYDLTPELRGNLLTIYDWNGQSAVFFPSLSWSPLGFLELSLGAQVGVGPRLSQYGESEALVYLLADLFF